LCRAAPPRFGAWATWIEAAKGADSSTKTPEFKDFGVSGSAGLNLDQSEGFPVKILLPDVRQVTIGQLARLEFSWFT
jgi:hypothetical protein